MTSKRLLSPTKRRTSSSQTVRPFVLNSYKTSKLLFPCLIEKNVVSFWSCLSWKEILNLIEISLVKWQKARIFFLIIQYNCWFCDNHLSCRLPRCSFCWDWEVQSCQSHQDSEGDQCGFPAIRVPGGYLPTLQHLLWTLLNSGRMAKLPKVSSCHLPLKTTHFLVVWSFYGVSSENAQ
jgi:hypothetical protein